LVPRQERLIPKEKLVLCVDLDGFRARVNDRFGHVAGNADICTAAQAIAAVAQPLGGMTYRWGGDEFVVLGLTDPATARRLGDAIRAAIRAQLDEHGVTASVGIAYADAPFHNIFLLWAAADISQSVAKQAGCDVTIVRYYPSDKWDQATTVSVSSEAH